MIKNLSSKFRALCVFVFCFVWFSVPVIVKAATLFLMPQSEDVYERESFFVEVRVDTEGEEINTANIILKFSNDFLEAIDFNKGSSIFSLWPEEANIKEGEISFLAGVPGGFLGEGLIGRINFFGKKVGEAQIIFKEDSKILLNDGSGTPAKLNFLEGNYEILEKPKDLPVISSQTHPDQNKWYKSNILLLHWGLVENTEYSYFLSKDSLAVPDETPDKPEGELEWMGAIEYKGLDEGIYYFSLRQKLPGKDWSGKVTFRAMIDTTSPEEFKPEIAEIEGKKYLVFSTTDKISGVDYYEVAIIPPKPLFGPAIRIKWEKGESPYLLEDKGPISKILIKAVDKAGNEKFSEITPPSKPFPYYILILALFIAGVIWWIIRRLRKKL